MYVDDLTSKQYSFLKFLYGRKVSRADIVKHFKGCENDSELTDSPFNEFFISIVRITSRLQLREKRFLRRDAVIIFALDFL